MNLIELCINITSIFLVQNKYFFIRYFPIYQIQFIYLWKESCPALFSTPQAWDYIAKIRIGTQWCCIQLGKSYFRGLPKSIKCIWKEHWEASRCKCSEWYVNLHILGDSFGMCATVAVELEFGRNYQSPMGIRVICSCTLWRHLLESSEGFESCQFTILKFLKFQAEYQDYCTQL